MSDFIVELGEERALDPMVVGGKGANLSILKRNGFNVPDALLISVDFFYHLMERIGEGDFVDSLRRGELPDRATLRGICEKLEGSGVVRFLPGKDLLLGRVADFSTYAVRSSFTGEDSEKFSFAGLGDSVVALESADELDGALVRVYKSFLSDAVMNYYRAKGRNVRPGAAVIVQKFVPGEFSGVLFTEMNGEVVLEFAPGTAIPLVQGTGQPGRYYIRKTDGRIVRKEIPSRFIGLFYEEGKGLVKRETASLHLPSKLVRELFDTGMRIARLFDSPRDLEWTYCCGQLFILQARAITHATHEENYHWSRVLGEEFWSGRVSPMMFSIVGKAIEEAMIKKPVSVLLDRNNNLLKAPAIELFYNHIYINLDVLKEAFRIIPRWALTKHLLKMFPPNMVEEIRESSCLLPLNLPIALLRFLTAGFPWFFHKNYRYFNRFVEERISRTGKMDIPDGLEENMEFLIFLRDELKEFLGIVVWGVTYAYISVPLTQQLFTMMVGEKAAREYSHILFSNLDGDVNTMFLRELSELAGSMPEEWKGIKNGDDLRRMEEKYPEFSRRFRAFIEKYGHRSKERDLIVPRWEEDPVTVVKILASSGRASFEELTVRDTWNRLKKLLRRDRVKINYLYFPVFYYFLWLARTYLTVRENMRFYADIYLLKMRRSLLRIGRVLVDEGRIDRVDDIFFLELDEIVHMDEKRDLREIVEKRRKAFDECNDAPDYIVGGEPFEIPHGDLEHLMGETVSPGIASGRVRVIRELDDFLLVEEGEIVVMSNLDPSWSSLVGKVAGAVFEVGGLLSHGAIIAREFGIPAIAGVKDATRRLKTGDRVVLDATAGTVTKIS